MLPDKTVGSYFGRSRIPSGALEGMFTAREYCRMVDTVERHFVDAQFNDSHGAWRGQCLPAFYSFAAGDVSSAVRVLNDLLRQQPANRRLHRLIGLVYVSQGRLRGATEHLELAGERLPALHPALPVLQTRPSGGRPRARGRGAIESLAHAPQNHHMGAAWLKNRVVESSRPRRTSRCWRSTPALLSERDCSGTHSGFGGTCFNVTETTSRHGKRQADSLERSPGKMGRTHPHEGAALRLWRRGA